MAFIIESSGSSGAITIWIRGTAAKGALELALALCSRECRQVIFYFNENNRYSPASCECRVCAATPCRGHSVGYGDTNPKNFDENSMGNVSRSQGQCALSAFPFSRNVCDPNKCNVHLFLGELLLHLVAETFTDRHQHLRISRPKTP